MIYAAREECADRVEVMESLAIVAFGHLPMVTMLNMCSDLDSIRRVAPGAYPGESAT